jgi:hypothetical protein
MGCRLFQVGNRLFRRLAIQMNFADFAQDACLKARAVIAAGELGHEGLQFGERPIKFSLPAVLLRHPEQVGLLFGRGPCQEQRN